MTNAYLEKIAKEQRDNSWVIPAVTASIPTIAYGVSRHGEYDLKTTHSPKYEDKLLQEALKKRNLKTTAAMAALTLGTAGVGEVARRHYMSGQKEQQTKDIKKAVGQVVKQASENKYLAKLASYDPQEDPHDWKPAAVAGAIEVPIGLGIGYAGKKLSERFFKGSGEATAIGLISGVAAAGEADYLQRRSEKIHKQKYLRSTGNE